MKFPFIFEIQPQQQLNKNNNTAPVGLGNIRLQIHHTRLRTKYSSLNQHLNSKNII